LEQTKVQIGFICLMKKIEKKLKAVQDDNPVYQVIEAGKEIEQPTEEVARKKKQERYS
jgi:hypothetical protein